MAGRSLIIRTGFALCSLVGLLAVGEVGLRLFQRPFAPADFQASNDPGRERAIEFAGAPVAFDPVLFWRRAAGAPPRREPGDFLVLVLGDGDALGLAGTKGPPGPTRSRTSSASTRRLGRSAS